MYSPTFINELCEKLYLKCSGRLRTELTMDVGENPYYPKESTIDLYVYAAVNNTYPKTAVDSISTRMAMANPGITPRRRAKKSFCVQSMSTALNRIEAKEPTEILTEMQRVNDKWLRKAVKKGMFENTFDASLDTHNVYRYTKIKRQEKRKRHCDDIQKAVGTKPKDGSALAHQYMTIKAVNGDFNPTLHFMPVLPFTNKVGLAETLITLAENKTNGKLDCILGDGDFDSIDMVNMYYSKNKHFLVRADKDAKVRKLIDEKCSGLWCYIDRNYTKGEGNHTATYNLVIVAVSLLRLYKIDMPLVDDKEKYLTFATDLSPEHGQSDMDFCISLVKRYKKRWGIETGYRDKIEFRGKTHALSYSVRLFFFLLSVFLYNLWIDINTEYRDAPERIETYPDGITKSVICSLFEVAILISANDFYKINPA